MDRRTLPWSALALAVAWMIWSATCLWGQELESAGPPADALDDIAFEQMASPAGCDCVSVCESCERTCACCGGYYVDWKTVPQSLRPMPRPGNFPIPPTGCGYYSLRDRLSCTCRDKAPKSGYPPFAMMPPSFFDADWRYVESLSPSERTFVERLKRIPLNDCWTLNTGGQFWARYMNEHNSRLTETDNSYTLGRMRAYGDLMYSDQLRFYGEFLWAESAGEELPSLPIDVNRGDVLNLFADLNLGDYQGAPVFARVGRQELLLGSQRLVSALDWANTRRTFEGARLFRKGDQWDVDAFYTALVPPNPNGFDQMDDNQEFGGAWATYRPEAGHFLDFYYLFLDNSNASPAVNGIVRTPSEVHTLGSRYAGDRDGFLWDVEGAVQVGDQNGRELFAGAVTAGVGRNYQDSCWNPTLWLYYDYASGDSDPTDLEAHTFNQLFPFGHYYLGWLDQVGRQNVHDANVHFFLYPQPWITVWMQYHHFWLNQSRDALYNAGGVPIRRDATGAAGTDVGDEVDLVLNFHIGHYSDLLVGYSRLFGGSFLERTSTAALAEDAELFYLMFQQRW